MTDNTPFFDSLVDRNGFMSQTASMTSPKSNQQRIEQPLPMPTHNPMNSSMSKYVAGSFRRETSDLIAPNNDYFTKNQPNPPPSMHEPYVCDLTTPDAKFERYKNLMRSKYYNLNVNSTTLVNDHSMKYSQPSPFTGYQNIIQE